jgi:hypothetical protein
VRSVAAWGQSRAAPPTKGLSGGYERVLADAKGGFDTRAMFDAIPILLLIAALVDAAVLYSIHVGRRVHQRRIDERLQESAHLYGLVRVTLAQRRAA